MISVIIPVYNIEKYLPHCLESVLIQAYRDLEIILVDDGSTDFTGAICDEYAQKDSRIVVIHKENGGVSSARNMGLDRAKGEYIAFVDGDDILHRDYFSVLLKNAVNYNSDISVCRLEMINTDGERRVNCSLETGKLDKSKIVKGFFFDENIKEIMYGPYNKLFKSEIINNIKFKQYKYGEDLLFVFMVLEQASSIYYDQYVGYSYVRREGSATKTEFSQSRLDYVYAAREIEMICKDKFSYAEEQAQCWVFLHTLNTMKRIKMCGEREKVREFSSDAKLYLKMHGRKCLPKLKKSKIVDFISVLYFPQILHIMKWWKCLVRKQYR